MKKVFMLFIVLSISVSALAQSGLKNSERVNSKTIVNDSTKQLFNQLATEYKKYKDECYKDSVLVNCYILLTSDGKTAKYDTICGLNLMMFDASGVAPVLIKVKSSSWVHKQSSDAEFLKWLKEKSK